MSREIRFSERLLLIGLSLILLFMIVQDWVLMGALNDVQAIANERSFNELLLITAIGSVQILLLMTFVIIFMGKYYPIWVKLWLIIHQLFIFAGALMDWWIPYLFGYGAEKRVEGYNQMFGDTHAFLPVMNGIVPNTLHVLFHLTLLICIILTVVIVWTGPKKNPI